MAKLGGSGRVELQLNHQTRYNPTRPDPLILKKNNNKTKPIFIIYKHRQPATQAASPNFYFLLALPLDLRPPPPSIFHNPFFLLTCQLPMLIFHEFYHQFFQGQALLFSCDHRFSTSLNIAPLNW